MELLEKNYFYWCTVRARPTSNVKIHNNNNGNKATEQKALRCAHRWHHGVTIATNETEERKKQVKENAKRKTNILNFYARQRDDGWGQEFKMQRNGDMVDKKRQIWQQSFVS